nr:MarR family winged helix-turn-helix transcriptional regulator [Halapricum sp. CBA1109]
MIHKRILDIAESRPSASAEEIAGEVGAVSGTFVEQVFEEYGDPANDPSRQQQPATDDADKTVLNDGAEPIVPDGSEHSTEGPTIETSDPPAEQSGVDDPETRRDQPPSDGTGNGGSVDVPDEQPVTDAEELNERQRATLRVIRRDPTATQAEVADQLDVTRATISKRVNDIAGFDWADRRAFVEQLFDGSEADDSEQPVQRETLDELEGRLSAIESRLADANRSTSQHTLPADLAHKVVHACMEAECVSEDEELELLEHLV